MNINQYLVDSFKKLGKSQTEVIKDLKKSQPYVSALMNGKKEVGGNVAKQLHDLYGFDISSVLTGKDSILKDENQTESKEIGYSKQKQLRVNKVELVPYYDIDVTSSIVGSFNDLQESPAYLVDFKPFNDCTAIVNNFGDSMYPKYKNGEKLAVKQVKNKDVIMWGETYLVITNSNANDLKAVKDVHPHEDENKVILRSSNPAYKGDTVIDKNDIVSMFAVKGKISQNFM